MRARSPVASRKRKKKVLKQAKGYWGRRSKNYRRAAETVRRAHVYAYNHRRRKKREFRALWITRLNAAARERGLSYRELIHQLSEKNIILSRNVLALIASENPEVFDQIVDKIKK